MSCICICAHAGQSSVSDLILMLLCPSLRSALSLNMTADQNWPAKWESGSGATQTLPWQTHHIHFTSWEESGPERWQLGPHACFSVCVLHIWDLD